MPLDRTLVTLHALGDESRLRLCALLADRELSVSELVRATGISQPRVSTHLGRLREAGIVRDRRVGASSLHALDGASLPATARAILDEALASEDPKLLGDRRRLAELDAERRGSLPESFAGEMDRHYSPGRTWQSLAASFSALLDLGDVLDVGSGDGAAAGFVARACRSLVCVDASPAMVAAARARLSAFPHARAELADAHALPFPDGSFDAVLALHTLTYVERPGAVLTECARVLRPGGKLVALSLDAHDHPEVTAPFGERHAGFSPDALRSMLRAAGLEPTRCEVACREMRAPRFRVVLAVAHPAPAPRGATRRRPSPRRAETRP